MLEPHRAVLWKVCYRMTGSAADADDLVQETFARALEHPPADLERDLRPWLLRVAINLSRDQLRARKRRGYVGSWLPSPIETELDADALQLDRSAEAGPEARYSELESVSMAFLIALEALSSSQRAVLLLRDVLGYSVAETATVLELSEANVKTTHHRARTALEHYDAERLPPTAEVRAATRDALHNFVLHLMLGNVGALEKLLAQDVRALNDGNGEYLAARSPIEGRRKVITFHVNVSQERPAMFAIREINGLPAMIAWFGAGGRRKRLAPRAVAQVRLGNNGRIAAVDTIVATEKLGHVRFAPTPKKAALGVLTRSRALLARLYAAARA
jgi:RNA polymerase sigma-70 factor (ECF subfamily)